MSQTLIRQHDWPKEGEMPYLPVQDLPHSTVNTEWWYINAHVTDKEQRDYSIFVAFFRVYISGSEEQGNIVHSHALNGAISQIDDKTYIPIAIMDQDAPKYIAYQVRNDKTDIDPRFAKALLEVLDQNELPLPDYKMKNDVAVSKDKFHLDYSGNIFTKDEQGNYLVKIAHPDGLGSFDVKLEPRKGLLLQGDDGIVKVGVEQESMYYYSIPNLHVTGTLSVNGESREIEGTGWYDHEFGGYQREGVYYTKSTGEVCTEKHDNSVEKRAWNWFAVQLEDNTQLSFTHLVDVTNHKKSGYDGKVIDLYVVESDPESKSYLSRDLSISYSKPWVSSKSSCKYYLRWNFISKELDMNLVLEAAYPEQEIMSMTAKPAFWEGRLHVTGKYRGKQVKGKAILESHNFSSMAKLENFFARMSEAVLEEIDVVIRHPISEENMLELMADKEHEHYTKGSDIDVFNKCVNEPLHEIIHRMGKAWRSYALILCIDAAGGNSYKYRHWLAMPEIMHVGSLIIDDIQDQSETRRNKKSCHKLIGEPLSINVGTFAYFIAIDALLRRTTGITDQTRLRLYDAYFLTLRAGHSGQAFDIYGLDHKMDAICNGTLNPEDLIENITCIHRLKSAVPAGNLAYMGALIGGGDASIAKAISEYFEAAGIAFQIIDDVLNLVVKVVNGVECWDVSDIGKLPCEDLRCGKITFPVIMALKKLSLEKRRELWSLLQVKPEDKEKITSEFSFNTLAPHEKEKLVHRLRTMRNILESVNALDDSTAYARNLVDQAWDNMKDKLPNSFYKLMIHSFGFYVLNRYY